MDSKLRTIDYEQKASFQVGRKAAGGDITFANFEANSWCSYTARYTVKFDYGNLTTEAHSFDTSGGVTALDFKIKSYNALFNETITSPTQGGDTINLGLTVENKNFKHADHLWTGESGKVFAPVSCNVKDKANDLTYTLFDTADSCSNSDVDLKVNFNEDANMWTFTHTLFLLGNFRKSSFELSCDVIVCEKSGDSAACNAVAKSCLAVDGVESEWAAWASCSATCGSGSRSRSRTCTNPAPAYGGADCTKALTEDEACKDKECPIHGKWSEYGQYSACSVTCGSGEQTRSRTCTNPAPAHGGNDCVGQADSVGSCFPKECPVNGNWAQWTTFGDCDNAHPDGCGEGTQSRTRQCSDPSPAHGGADCAGTSFELRSCDMPKKCAVDGNWAQWTTFGECGNADGCGEGSQSRTRQCSDPSPAHGGADCAGTGFEVQGCDMPKKCAVNGNWAQWQSWFPCSDGSKVIDCGEGNQSRTRYCNDPAPAHGGASCVGDKFDGRACTLAACGADSVWFDGTDGEELECAAGYVATGVCGSGKIAECGNGIFHRLQCTKLKNLNNIVKNDGWKLGRWGKTVACPATTLITGRCGSGRYGECGPPNDPHHTMLQCSTLANGATVDDTACQSFGIDAGVSHECPSGFAILEACGSGANADCKADGEDNKGVRGKCCPIVYI